MGRLFANPLDSPELMNTIVLAAKSFGPFGDFRGKFELQDCDGRPFKWDIKDAPGTQGATITYRGSRPSKFRLAFYFWEAQQITDFDANIMPLLTIDATKTTPRPVDVLQLQLAALDIFSIVPGKVGEYHHEGKGLISIKIECGEYNPSKKKNVTTTPNSTITSGKPGKPRQLSTFEQNLDAENAKLLEQAKRLNTSRP